MDKIPVYISVVIVIIIVAMMIVPLNEWLEKIKKKFFQTKKQKLRLKYQRNLLKTRAWMSRKGLINLPQGEHLIRQLEQIESCLDDN